MEEMWSAPEGNKGLFHKDPGMMGDVFGGFFWLNSFSVTLVSECSPTKCLQWRSTWLASCLLKPIAELFSESGPESSPKFKTMLQGKDLQLYYLIKQSRDHCLHLKKHGTAWLLSIQLSSLSPKTRWSHLCRGEPNPDLQHISCPQ